jgi:predicted metal-dependent enzyme (double-stranded beta helix superfamily)
VIEEKPYAQYLLHRPEDRAFSIVSFVWNPGQGSPIHDHCTWGVIGQYDGEEDEIRFRRLPGRLERISTVRARPGDVSHVYPPDRDIHQIENRTTLPTISIHVYGGDIGSQPRHVYDPVGDITAYPGSYKNKEVTVVGEVTQAVGASIGSFNRGVYEISDGTGNLWVYSESRGIPSRGAHVGVKGRIAESVTIMGHNYATVLKESDRRLEKPAN